MTNATTGPGEVLGRNLPAHRRVAAEGVRTACIRDRVILDEPAVVDGLCGPRPNPPPEHSRHDKCRPARAAPRRTGSWSRLRKALVVPWGPCAPVSPFRPCGPENPAVRPGPAARASLRLQSRAGSPSRCTTRRSRVDDAQRPAQQQPSMTPSTGMPAARMLAPSATAAAASASVVRERTVLVVVFIVVLLLVCHPKTPRRRRRSRSRRRYRRGCTS